MLGVVVGQAPEEEVVATVRQQQQQPPDLYLVEPDGFWEGAAEV